MRRVSILALALVAAYALLWLWRGVTGKSWLPPNPLFDAPEHPRCLGVNYNDTAQCHMCPISHTCLERDHFMTASRHCFNTEPLGDWVRIRRHQNLELQNPMTNEPLSIMDLKRLDDKLGAGSMTTLMRLVPSGINLDHAFEVDPSLFYDIDHQDEDGSTALHHAVGIAYLDHGQKVRELLARGADPTIQDNMHMYASDLAMNRDLKALLERAKDVREDNIIADWL